MTLTEPETDLSRLRIDRSSPRRSGGGRGLVRLLLVAIPLALAIAGVLVLRQRAGAVEVKVARADVRGGSAGAGGGITANGYVVARTKASVSSKISGRLESLSVTEGTEVEKGDVIARLEAADYAGALSEARANLARARAGLLEARADRDQLRRDDERMRRLLAADAISAQEAESAS